MVWTGIGYDGRTSLHVYEPGTKVAGDEYIDCMEQALLPSIDNRQYLFPKGEPNKWIYMQDGAGCHQSKKVIQWIRKNLTGDGARVATPSVNWREDGPHKWPSNSPDCNPIENLWAYFQDAVAKEDPKTTEQFRTLLDDAWWKIDQDVIRNLYHSMHSRLHHVIAAEGKMTKY